jgi:peroxiredoxin
VVLVACDQQYRLYGFHMSSPLPLPFLMLADHDGALHQRYGLDQQPGMVLIDHSGVIRQRWNVSGESIWAPMQSIVQAIEAL